MECKKCGEKLPEGARFCPACGTPVDPADEVPAPRRLEEPLEPMGVGAVPLVPVAPPPRATRIRPRVPRAHDSRDAHPGSSAARFEFHARPIESAEVDDPAPREAEAVPDTASEQAAADRTAALAVDAAHPEKSAPAVEKPANKPLGSSVRGAFGRLRRSGALPVIGVVAVAVVVVVVFLGMLSTSWLGPFAPDGAEAPVVQPPSDGSIAPLGGQGDEVPEEAGTEVPEGAPEVRDAVDDYSWDELAQISALIAQADSDEAGLEIATTYHLCDEDGELDGTQTKSLELSDGTEVEMRVAGFRQDNRADGEGVAGITFLAADGVADQPMNATGQLAGGWEGSTLRTWMNEHLIGELPEELSALIVPVEKRTNPPAGTGETGQDVTEDALWVPSFSEIVGQPSAGSSRASVYESEGDQYQLFADLGVDDADRTSEIIIPSGEFWWQRSPDVTNDRWFMVVSPEGQPNYGHRPATENAVVMGFCI